MRLSCKDSFSNPGTLKDTTATWSKRSISSGFAGRVSLRLQLRNPIAMAQSRHGMTRYRYMICSIFTMILLLEVFVFLRVTLGDYAIFFTPRRSIYPGLGDYVWLLGDWDCNLCWFLVYLHRLY